MKTNQKFLLILLIQTGLSFLAAALFVILYFRIWPNHMILLFPSVFGFGLFFGLLCYLPFKYFVEKR
jgi:hypothetical protein